SKAISSTISPSTRASTGTPVLGRPNSVITVRTLFENFYERACKEHHWGLVRHFAGAVGKWVEDLAKCVTDLLVCQKQVTVGIPPHGEQVITRPLSNKELRDIISDVYQGDENMAMLTQELIAYLATFIQTDPHLFHEMLRLRVGLIIEVMASELSRAMGSKDQDNFELLFNLSPYETQTLLRAIRERPRAGGLPEHLGAEQLRRHQAHHCGCFRARIRDGRGRTGSTALSRCLDPGPVPALGSHQGDDSRGVQVRAPGRDVLNRIPEPENRQLLVETLMVLSLVVENDSVDRFRNEPLDIEGIVRRAHALFIEYQWRCNRDATLCCCVSPPLVPCQVTVGICERF
ncbi:hypothetical protein MRX96_050580, partial [Rhipicephalus microplus]